MSVTDSFLTLEKSVINCQEEETYDDCITENYIDALVDNCNCYALNLGLTEKVIFLTYFEGGLRVVGGFLKLDLVSVPKPYLSLWEVRYRKGARKG